MTDFDVIVNYVGKSINVVNFERCATKNRVNGNNSEYIIYSSRFLYDKALREVFGVTDKLKDLWERRGTEFNIYLYISDGVLTDANILKYTESGGARPSMTTPKCTQQELRIARRILEYITE